MKIYAFFRQCWIATWASGIVGVDVVTILCWYHLCKRVHEGLSGLGVAKEERKKWEREILGHLGCGEHGSGGLETLGTAKFSEECEEDG